MHGAEWWDKTSTTNLLDRIIHLWITIREFSYASAWLERYRTAQKKSTQNQKASGNEVHTAVMFTSYEYDTLCEMLNCKLRHDLYSQR